MAINLSVAGTIRNCLAYVRLVFGVPIVYPSAWQAWANAKYRHTDRNLPNVPVPVFFSYTATIDGVTANYGHVVVWVPGVGFYSSPWKAGTAHAVLTSIEQIEQIYTTHENGGTQQVTFVGWSEDLNGIRVAEITGGTMGDTNSVAPTDKDVDTTIDLMREVAGYPDDRLDGLLDQQRPLLKNNFVEGVQTVLNNYLSDKNRPTGQPTSGTQIPTVLAPGLYQFNG